MRKLFKISFKFLLFLVNIGFGILATFYLVLRFKAHRKAKNPQLEFVELNKDPKLADSLQQSKRTDQVYKLIKELKEVDMTVLLSKIKGVTERTLRRDLAKLQTMKLIKKSGSTKSTKYTLAK